MSEQLQEVLALAVVAAVVGLYLWRRWQRRRRSKSACGGCEGGASDTSKEKTLRFYKRR